MGAQDVALTREERRERALALVRDGASFRAAGAVVGCSGMAVRNWCQAAGIQSNQAARRAVARREGAAAIEAAVVQRAVVGSPLAPPAGKPGASGVPGGPAGGDAARGPATAQASGLPELLGDVEERVADRVRRLAAREGRPVGQVLSRLLPEVLWRWE